MRWRSDRRSSSCCLIDTAAARLFCTSVCPSNRTFARPIHSLALCCQPAVALTTAHGNAATLQRDDFSTFSQRRCSSRRRRCVRMAWSTTLLLVEFSIKLWHCNANSFESLRLFLCLLTNFSFYFHFAK